MKKILLLFLLTLSIHSYVLAQQKGTMDAGITIGAITTNEIINTTSDVLETSFTGGYASYSNTKASPAITANYKYALKDKWMLFGDISYQLISKDVLVNNTAAGELKSTYLTLGIGTEYHYLSTAWVQLYSGGSIAITNAHEKYTGSSADNSANFNFQLNGIGCRVGKAFAGTAELGFGYRGIFNIGASYQF